MSTPESVIIRAIHEAFIKYPEGDGGPNLDYQWVQPEQSAHVAKAILLELAANGFKIVNDGARCPRLAKPDGRRPSQGRRRFLSDLIKSKYVMH